MELPDITVSVLLLLTDLLVTALIGMQVYLFKQISAARREHLEFRIKVAGEYVSIEHLDKALSKLEENIERVMTALLRNTTPRK
jgi:hypothetical protein